MTIEDVYLIVGKSALRGFQEINIARSAKDAAISFGFRATNPAWTEDAFKLRLGAEVEAYTSSDLLVRGYIDNYAADHGEEGNHEVRCEGRSKAQDAIDCHPAKHATGRIENKTLLDAAKEFDEFGVGFTTDQQLKPIPKIQRNPDETVFQTIERYARREGLLLQGEPNGNIKITKAGTKRHAGALVEGQPPIKRFGVKFSAANKHSPVVVRGQRAIGTDNKVLRQEIKEFDPNVGRYRPLVVFAEGDHEDAKLKKRAEWEVTRRAGAGTTASVRVAGWRDEAGMLWTPGRLVAVQFPSERLDQDMTIASVTYRQTLDEGTTCDLELADPRSLGGKDPKGKSDKAYNAKDVSE